MSATTLKPPSDQVELNDLGASLGKRKRFGSGDYSNFSGSNRSMDLCLKSEDLLVDAGRIKSSDFIRDEILKSDEPQDRPAGKLPTLKLAKELYRNSSRDWANDFGGQPSKPADPSVFSSPDMNIPPLPLDRIGSGEFRLSSGDFFKIPSIDLGLGPLDPSLYVNCPSPADVAAQLTGSTVTPPPLPPLYAPPAHHYQAYEEYEVPITGSENEAPMPKSGDSDAKPTKASKRKRRKPRMIDESKVVVPTDNDVLFGRGGFTNTHPGNLRFRAKALELRPWYSESTKEDKQRIADVLVEFIKADGHRFVEKGKDGLWHEVIGNGAHTKASQALRERLKKDRKKSK
jgi:hypothetical protein